MGLVRDGDGDGDGAGFVWKGWVFLGFNGGGLLLWRSVWPWRLVWVLDLCLQVWL